jgi:DNA-binding beta-propeller fold protein YncE
MIGKRKEERLIRALMVFVLISLLFFSSVVFGQMSDPFSTIHGNIYCNDGKLLVLNDSSNTTDLLVVNKDTNHNTVLTTNNSGVYDSGSIFEPGNYTLYAYYNKDVIGSRDFTIMSGADTPLDLTTSRMPTN